MTDAPEHPFRDIPSTQTVAEALAAALEQDAEIVAGLPSTVCASVAEAQHLMRYVWACIRNLSSRERDALLAQVYLSNLVGQGVVSIPPAVLRAAFDVKVRGEAPSDGD